MARKGKRRKGKRSSKRSRFLRCIKKARGRRGRGKCVGKYYGGRGKKGKRGKRRRSGRRRSPKCECVC